MGMLWQMRAGSQPAPQHMIPRGRRSRMTMNDQTPSATSETAQSQASGPLKRYGPILAIVVAAVVIYLNGWHEYLSLSKVAENREYLQNFVSSNLLLALLIYAGLYIAVVAFSLPGGAAATTYP